MKYRAKIYIGGGWHVTSQHCNLFETANFMLRVLLHDIKGSTGGHIERYVDGIGWVVCEEPEVSDE